MSKHTPGPWEVFEREPDKNYLRVRGPLGRRFKVANVINTKQPDEREWAETEANAKLIAAAPQMLEALQTAFDLLQEYQGMYQHPDNIDPVMDEIEVVLMAAKGEGQNHETKDTGDKVQ